MKYLEIFIWSLIVILIFCSLLYSFLSIKNRANCLKSGYPISQIIYDPDTGSLKKYCLTIDGSVRAVVIPNK
jgi:hypothetical protein